MPIYMYTEHTNHLSPVHVYDLLQSTELHQLGHIVRLKGYVLASYQYVLETEYTQCNC